MDGLAGCSPTRAAGGGVLPVPGLVPLLGSVITEPAAHDLSALMLRDRYFSQRLTARLRYATLGTSS